MKKNIREDLKMEQLLYIASHEPRGGILRCRLCDGGKLRLLDKVPLDRPAYLCAEGNRLHAVLREPFMMQSGVAAFEILPGGELCQLGAIQPAHGTVSAYVLSKNGVVYTANYLTGTTTRMPDKILAHNGSSVDPERQTCSHPHCLTLSPDGKYLCISDLGTDCIYVVTLALEEVSRVQAPAGSGPRHLVFSPEGGFAYGANELNSTVSVYSWADGKLTHLYALSALPEGYTETSYSSAIRISPDGRTLYVSNRGHDSVCIWDVAGEKLTNQRFLKSNGKSPREINLLGDYLLCGNEGSSTVTVFDLRTMEQTDTLEVVNPWCILGSE